MCLILPSRVISIDDDRAVVEQPDGRRVSVNCALRPDVRPGDHVLVDRGFIIEKIEPAEAAAIMQMFAEMDEVRESSPGVDESVAC